MYGTSSSIISIIIYLGILCGLYLFKQGFLLSRLSLSEFESNENIQFRASSNTADNLDLNSSTSNQISGFIAQESDKKFQRIVLVLIDALRFDYISPVPGLSYSSYSGHKPRNQNEIFNGMLQSHGRMKNISGKLMKLTDSDKFHSDYLKIFHFFADPPTTTLQRIHGLLTGSLPTFVDASSNFGSDRISEDTWLFQAKKKLFNSTNSLKTVFLGDDTWLKLLGEKAFDVAFGVESFDVWDLDGLDAKVLDKIWKYFPDNQFDFQSEDSERKKFKLLIAHFLGVDHAGHKHSPDHPEMARKLQQMNDIVGDVMEKMEDDCLLLIMGDHGMDGGGDHGGDSLAEIDAGFAVYSKKKLLNDAARKVLDQLEDKKLDKSWNDINFDTNSKLMDDMPSMSQIDLVPTLSTMFGFPITFGNLGSIVPEIFLAGFNINDELILSLKLLSAVRYNAAQMLRYLYTYHEESGRLGEVIESNRELYLKSEYMFELVSKNASLRVHLFEPKGMKKYWAFGQNRNDINVDNYHDLIYEAMVNYMAFSKKSLAICRHLWAEFDLKLISLGISLFVVSFIMLVYWSVHPQRFLNWNLKNFSAILLLTYISFTFINSHFGELSGGIFLVVAFVSLFLISLWNQSGKTQRKRIKLDISKSWIFGFVLVLNVSLFGSDSFVLHEDWVITLLIQSCLLFLIFEQIKTRSSVVYLLACMCLVRLTATSTVCREENLPNCEKTFHIFPPIYPSQLGFFGDNIFSPHLTIQIPTLLVLLINAIILPFILKILIPKNIQNSRISPIHWFLLGVIMQCSTLYWSIEAMEERSERFIAIIEINEKWSIKIWTARLGFLLSILGFLSSFAHSTAGSLIRVLYTFCFIIMTQLPTGVWMLSIGLIQAFIIISWLQNTSRKSGKSYKAYVVTMVISLLAQHHFFSTGHQATFSSIHFQTGFIGLNSYDFYLSGALVVLNSIGSWLVFGACLAYHISLEPKDSRIFHYALALVHQIALTLSATIFALYFRRHLQVWRIFAPRFMLSGVETLIRGGIIIIMVLFLTESKLIKTPKQKTN